MPIPGALSFGLRGEWSVEDKEGERPSAVRLRDAIEASGSHGPCPGMASLVRASPHGPSFSCRHLPHSFHRDAALQRRTDVIRACLFLVFLVRRLRSDPSRARRGGGLPRTSAGTPFCAERGVRFTCAVLQRALAPLYVAKVPTAWWSSAHLIAGVAVAASSLRRALPSPTLSPALDARVHLSSPLLPASLSIRPSPLPPGAHHPCSELPALRS